MVQVNKQQLEMIEKILERYKGNKTKAALSYVPSQIMSIEMFVDCMIHGYELMKSKEDLLLDFYKGKQGPTRYAIRQALYILGIFVGGISDDSED